MAEAVKVIVRCRPLNGREKNLKCQNVIEMDASIGQCRLLKPNDKSQTPKAFTFDGVFNTDSITETIYSDICFPLVEGCLEGYNGTVFAYGQTGCGKSFSMQGITDPPTQRGIIPRAFEHIFEAIQVAEDSKFLVHASYLEIYNEEIRDLLSKNHKSKLDVKEHPDRGVYVKDLQMIPCNTVQEMEQVMDRGAQNRSVGATLMNADSSRSHSIFTIFIETTDKNQVTGEEHIRAAKLNLVDLAGSERQAKTGASGDRLKEATKINLSLSALGNVISALVDGKSKHIPYRDSKLTRLLQDSLGGNTKTLMVACISPADNNYDETLSTLRYANRAKNIKNKPKINEDPKDALLRQFQDEINFLKQVLTGKMEMTPDILAKLGLGANAAAMIPSANLSKPGDVYQGGKAGTAQQQQQKNENVQQGDRQAEKETERIRSEYEQKLSAMQKKFDDEQLSKQKLEEEVGELQKELHRSIKEASQTVSGFQNANAMKIIDDFNENLNTISADVLPLDRNLEFDEFPAPEEPNNNNRVQPPGHQQPVNTFAAQLENVAMEKLNLLQERLVGGEKSHNVELKKERKKKKDHAREREKDMIKNIKKWEGEKIMVKVYDNLQEEIKSKREEVLQLEFQLNSANSEISDLQSEFQAERTDYLESIRKLERQIMLQNQIMEKIQPTIRRDCNYYNLDRMKILSEFDEEKQCWKIPDLLIERTSLPKGPDSPASINKPLQDHSTGTAPKTSEYIDRNQEVDRYSMHIHQNRENEEYSNHYFRPKRAGKLLTNSMSTTAPTSMNNVSSNYNNNNSLHNNFNTPNNNNSIGKLQPLSGPNSNLPTQTDQPQLTRRPQKLEALPPSAFEKNKNKKMKNRDF